MREPKRILAKLLGPGAHLDRIEATGEPLDRVVEILRQVVKCRRVRRFLSDTYGFDVALTPPTFTQLLEIPQINFVETPTRNLEMEVVSLQETRNPDDPVSVGNLNRVLRELYRSLSEIRDLGQTEYPELLLVREITPDRVERTAEWTATLGALRGQLTGFLFTRGQARAVEQAFQTAFPRSKQAHPLRKTLAKVEHELGFYRKCLKENRKWQALGLDLFQILREDGLVHLLENLEELGTLLWNIVYNSPPIQESLGLTGIEFGDVRSLFEEERVPVRNG